jgi:hypothetical protein
MRSLYVFVVASLVTIISCSSDDAAPADDLGNVGDVKDVGGFPRRDRPWADSSPSVVPTGNELGQ